MMHTRQAVGERVTAALRSLPRERFIEMSDSSLVLGRSIPPTNAVSEILKHAAIEPEHRVLQVGTGAGYTAALCAALAESVVTIEIIPAMANQAQKRFNQLCLANLILRVEDGAHGAPDLGPYDRILVSTPKILDMNPLISQLADGGKLVALEQGENETHLLASYELSELGAVLRKELALVDFSRDTGMTLLDMGMVDQVMLSEARRLARRRKEPVIKVLRDKLNLEDTTLYRRLAEENGMPFASVDDLLGEVQPELMEGFSRSFLDSHHLIPLRVDNRCLRVVTDDPDSSVDDIYHMYPYDKVTRVLVIPNDFKRLWTTVELSLMGESHGDLKELEELEPNDDLLNIGSNNVEAHLVTLCDALLLEAVSDNASDLHIEQYRFNTRVRLRIDGDLQDLNHYKLSNRDARGLINVLKIRGDMDIAEKRLPQGGRSQLTAGGVTYDLRIQVQPSLHGEAVVIRMLPQSGNLVGIGDLGMGPQMVQDYRRLLQNPSGLVLVVGPTGSGKSTTLYAGLSEIAEDSKRKVLTIEDPIEYSIEGIQQSRARPDIGFSFADGMRSFVRLDPDVILVGEIRDMETAIEAIRASQTGHVVLSTLHANDAVDALQRLYDLEVHANSIASELMAVISQKLAKRICENCRTPAEPDPTVLAELFPEGTPEGFSCFEGAGCSQCGQRGTSGRVAVVEYMQVNGDIREGISLRYPIARLRAIALDSGLVTLRDSALNHVTAGTIPLSELPRILPAERMAPEKRGNWS